MVIRECERERECEMSRKSVWRSVTGFVYVGYCVYSKREIYIYVDEVGCVKDGHYVLNVKRILRSRRTIFISGDIIVV